MKYQSLLVGDSSAELAKAHFRTSPQSSFFPLGCPKYLLSVRPPAPFRMATEDPP